ncbi:MAG: peptidylprolyl isomerase [Pseudobdellovibrio sp.]
MKTNTYKPNRLLVFWIYLVAFALMTFSFHSRAAGKVDTKKAAKETVVVIDTSMGKITVKLNAEKAPITVENFLKYIEKKHYDNTIFHRVMKDFMIQGGGHTADMTEKPTEFPPIKNEADNGLFNKRGTISMARMNETNSATAQFFINVVDNAMLDYQSPARFGYAVFGEVTAGMDIVDKIRNVAVTTKGPHENVPVQPITIKTITKK